MTKLLREPALVSEPTVCGIGTYDALHLGHQQLLKRVESLASQHDLSSLLLSFYRHPLATLKPEFASAPMFSWRERLLVLDQLRIDYLYLLRFSTALSQMSAMDFSKRILRERLNCTHLVVGEDAAVGKGREGDVAWMQEKLGSMGISVHVMEFVNREDRKIASRDVRKLVEAGDCAAIAEHLGRPYSLTAKVRHGEARGRRIGFPTANLAFTDRLLPANGVYAGYVMLDGEKCAAVANLGVRPTFGIDQARKLEVHIIGREDLQLYGQNLSFFFLKKLRNEKKFESLEELVGQIARDRDAAQALFDEMNS